MFDWLNEMSTTEIVWVLIGFTGQALFASRFIIQWFRSEQVGRSVIPLAFWYCSIGGGVVLFSYALYRQDPVFIAGQGLGLFVYARNLILIFREKKNGASVADQMPEFKPGAPQSAQDIVAKQATLSAAARQRRLGDQAAPDAAQHPADAQATPLPASETPLASAEKA